MTEIIVKPGDTLSKIAKDAYGDITLAKTLATFNGIEDANRIFVGQQIEIPSLQDLVGTAPVPPVPGASPAAPAPGPGLNTPQGLDQLIATFGNIRPFIKNDGTLDSEWERQELTRAGLPFPIPYTEPPHPPVTKIYCHKKLSDIFVQVFTEIQKQGLADKIVSYGGCFNFRSKRTSTKISTHAWGIAVDLNPETNQQGTNGNMDPQVIRVFQSFGFKWGGEFSGKSQDPMHFQFCTGY
jgi:LysM repeat protein